MTIVTTTALLLTGAATAAWLTWTVTCWRYARQPGTQPRWVGLPGAQPRQRARRTAGRYSIITGALAGATIAPLLTAALVGTDTAPTGTSTIGLLVAAAVGTWAATRWRPGSVNAARKAWAGADAETRTARALLKALDPDAIIFNGVPVRSLGDIDHVAITRNGIWTIETKAGKGRIHLEHGTLHAGRRRLERDGTRQANQAAQWLSRQLATPVGALVCIPQGDNGATLGNTPVCGADALPWALGHTHTPITLDQARAAWTFLTRQLNTGSTATGNPTP